MASTTNQTDAQTGWTRLCATDQFAPHLGAAHSVQTDSGTLTALEPVRARGQAPDGRAAFCAVFPGYTGDALSHSTFISAALAAGIGVVAVNPKWGNSTRRMRENAESLFQALSSGPIETGQIHFIRGVSFGAYLSLSWVGRLSTISKLALVTPCSAAQLPYAGRQMGIEVQGDDLDPTPGLRRIPRVRLLPLTKDSIVPMVDPLFAALSDQIEYLELPGTDHFTAGDLPAASTELAEWFAE